MKIPCKACRNCPGLALREIWGEGWRPQMDGSWKKHLPEQEGRQLVKDIAASRTDRCVEVVTDTFGTRYVEVMR